MRFQGNARLLQEFDFSFRSPAYQTLRFPTFAKPTGQQAILFLAVPTLRHRLKLREAMSGRLSSNPVRAKRWRSGILQPRVASETRPVACGLRMLNDASNTTRRFEQGIELRHPQQPAELVIHRMGMREMY